MRLGNVGKDMVKFCTSIKDSLLSSPSDRFGTIEVICINVNRIPEVLFG